jgi:hypothetical protein
VRRFYFDLTSRLYVIASSYTIMRRPQSGNIEGPQYTTKGSPSLLPPTDQVPLSVTLSCILFIALTTYKGEHAVTWLVEALCYKPQGCGFDSI